MTDDEIAAIRERAAFVGDKVWDVPDGDMNGRILAIGPVEGYDGDALGFREGDPTIEFIAHSPADVHLLLAENAALREIAAAVAEYAPLQEEINGFWVYLACPFCEEDPETEPTTHHMVRTTNRDRHAADCPVTKARALLAKDAPTEA